MNARHFGLVRIKDSDGRHGIGLAYVGTTAGELLSISVEKILAPVLLGRDTLEVEQLWTDMYQEALDARPRGRGHVGHQRRGYRAVGL